MGTQETREARNDLQICIAYTDAYLGMRSIRKLLTRINWEIGRTNFRRESPTTVAEGTLLLRNTAAEKA